MNTSSEKTTSEVGTYIAASYIIHSNTKGEAIADKFMELSDLFDNARMMPRYEFYQNFEPVFEEAGILYIIGRDSKHILATGGLECITCRDDLDNSRLRFKIYRFNTTAIIYARDQKEGLHNTHQKLGTEDISQLIKNQKIKSRISYQEL